ncbi:unnamed protein product [Musa acuminata var. zebrina]
MCSKKLSSLFAAFAATKTSKNPKPVPPSPEFVPPKKSPDPIHFTNSSPPSSGSETAEKPAGVVSKQVLSRLKPAASRISKSSLAPGEAVDSAFGISKAISSILSGENDMSHPSSSKESADGMLLKNILDVPWFSSMSQINTTQWKKEVSRERKQKYIFKNTESRRFVELMKKCADKLGTKSTVEFFGRLGREMGLREYNALIGLCISKARNCSNEEDSMVHIKKAYGLFASMREKGLQIEEQSYGPLLMYMIDMKLTQEFQMFSEFFKDENPESSSRIGYYEMLLWISVGNEDKIRELIDSVGVADTQDSYKFAESYLLAFCKSDRKEELLRLLEVVNIWKVSSPKYINSVFQTLGRLQLEALTEKIILQLKTAGFGEEDISFYIYEYTTCVPNLAVEDVVSKFINLHQKLGIIPSISSYEKVIMHCCNSCKIYAALDIVDHICKSGLDVPIQCFHPILHACEQYGELDMVHPVYSMMQQHNLTPKGDFSESMISLFVKMKDFEGAYNLLAYERDEEMPTTSMYNIIMAGYFRSQQNYYGALNVLKQMEDADIKPDSKTFSYLIANCKCEEDIVKYRDEMRHSGIEFTKYVYMALINAYAKFGNFEMAKQVVLDKEIPVKYINEIKSVLVSALSSNGQINDALCVSDEIKQAGSNLEPKAVISLIEHIRAEGELDRLLQLLGELKDSNSWFDGCSRVILYCIQYNLSSTAIELLKQLKEKDKSSTYIVIDQIFSQIWETTPTNVKIGVELLQAVKEELELHPSRTSLDFLLSTCVKAKDSQLAWFVWAEYEAAGLSYNVSTFVRMYQALLASREQEAANEMLKQIPKEDPHVRCLIQSCKTAYCY